MINSDEEYINEDEEYMYDDDEEESLIWKLKEAVEDKWEFLRDFEYKVNETRYRWYEAKAAFREKMDEFFENGVVKTAFTVLAVAQIVTGEVKNLPNTFEDIKALGEGFNTLVEKVQGKDQEIEKENGDIVYSKDGYTMTVKNEKTNEITQDEKEKDDFMIGLRDSVESEEQHEKEDVEDLETGKYTYKTQETRQNEINDQTIGGRNG